jgi:hypothetical protein
MTAYDIIYVRENNRSDFSKHVEAKDINEARAIATANFDTRKYKQAFINVANLWYENNSRIVYRQGYFYWLKVNRTKWRYELYTFNTTTGRLKGKVASGSFSNWRWRRCNTTR